MDRATETDQQDVFTTETAGHCQIAEHNQSGMMFSFHVARRPERAR